MLTALFNRTMRLKGAAWRDSIWLIVTLSTDNKLKIMDKEQSRSEILVRHALTYAYNSLISLGRGFLVNTS